MIDTETETGAGKIFVTGGSGFIGSHLLEKLHRQGGRITVLSRSPIEPEKRGRPPLPPDTVVVRGDLTDPGSYREHLRGQDILIHLAADYRVGLPPSRRIRRAMYQTNVEGTLNLLDAAEAEGIPRLIHISTTAALGETGDVFGDETHRHNGVFRCYYEESKHIAHELAVERQKRGAPINIAILGGVFGPGDGSVIAQTIKAYFRGKIPFQVSTGSRFHLCHVNDVCEGIMRLLQADVERANYLFTGGDFSMPEIFALLAEIAGRTPLPAKSASSLKPLASIMDALSTAFGFAMPLSREALAVMDGSNYLYRSDKAQRELGWSAGDARAAFIRHAGEIAVACGLSPRKQ